jgi:sugar lactone lactonase YvrE
MKKVLRASILLTILVRTVLTVQLLTILIAPSVSYGWTGDTWGSIGRETILKTAEEMIDFSWSPLSTITNCGEGDFSSDTVYYGIAYCQQSPQEDWGEFYDRINSTSGGTTFYGNDRAGFVSISWKLPKKYTIDDFLCDALDTASPCGDNYNSSSDDYLHSLGGIGTASKVNLLTGDALLKADHILLFQRYLFDGSGILAMEQIPEKAVRSEYKWEDLILYRPIRRNKITDYDYIFKNKQTSSGGRNPFFNDPQGIAIDSSKDIYVADTNNHRIQRFNKSGDLITEWGLLGNGQGQFRSPTGVAVDSSKTVYVADTNNHRIQKFDNMGHVMAIWGSNGTEDGQFSFPTGVAVDSSKKIYVADTQNHRIQKFSASGTFETQWGSLGSEKGNFTSPTGVAVDPGGYVYVADLGNNRIQKFDSNGKFILEWGSGGNGEGQFSSLSSIAVDAEGCIYAADSGNDRIQKFDGGGNFIIQFGSTGSGDGNFASPKGVAVNSSGAVYIADTNNDRIQWFSRRPVLPAGPINLTAKVASARKIILSWSDRSNNETGFKIKRKVDVQGTYEVIGTVDANVNTYTDTGVLENTPYYYTVWAYNDNGRSAYSNEIFSYSVRLGMITPNGGETLPSGSLFTIQWEEVGSVIAPLQYSIKYSMDGGETWKLITTGITDKSYEWTTPSPAENKKNCLVRIIGYDINGVKRGMAQSKNVFGIEVVKVTSPSDPDVLMPGTNWTITWETNGTIRDVARVKLFYTTNGAETWHPIYPDPPDALNGNPKSYVWTVPLVTKEKKKCKVKVLLKDANGKTIGIDASDGYFTISPLP